METPVKRVTSRSHVTRSGYYVYTVAKVLDYNMVYSQGLPNDKKWDNHFLGGNSHLKAEQTTLQFQTTA